MQPVIPRSSGAGKAVVYAAEQPQYRPLPALVSEEGAVFTEWELTRDERDAVARGARLILSLMPFGGPLQPVRLEVEGVEPEPPVGTPR